LDFDPAMTQNRTHSHADDADVSLKARIDLATGLVAAGVVQSPGAASLAAVMAQATLSWAAWQAGGQRAPIVLALPGAAFDGVNAADAVMVALSKADIPFERVAIQFEEADLAAAFVARLSTLERLRSAGMGIVMSAAASPVLPIGGRLRQVLTEIVLDLPKDNDPYLGLEGWTEDPFARRLGAALESDVLLTARGSDNPTTTAWAARIGFRRAEGGSVWTSGRLVRKYAEAKRAQESAPPLSRSAA
jgi:hypothetical protein